MTCSIQSQHSQKFPRLCLLTPLMSPKDTKCKLIDLGPQTYLIGPQHTFFLPLQMRVVVGTDDPDIAGIDGGAFLEYLQRQEEEAQQGASSVRLSALQPRVAVIGHTFKPIPASLEAPELSVLGKSLPAVRQEAASAIATPSYTNIQSSLGQGRSLCPLLFAPFC